VKTITRSKMYAIITEYRHGSRYITLQTRFCFGNKFTALLVSIATS